MRTLLAAFVLAAPLAARAQATPPSSPYEVLGFSPDDAYVAIVEHGVASGSGFPWARLTIYDVVKGQPVARSEANLDSGSDKDTEESAVAAVKKKGEAEQARLKIDKWVKPKTIALDEKGAMSDHEGAPIGQIELKGAKASPKQKAKACPAPFKPLLLKATVHFMDDDKPFKLADEKKVPKDRPCAEACTLDQVFAHGKAALVVARCAVQGFEGPTSQLVPLAARLPYGLDEDLPQQ